MDQCATWVTMFWGPTHQCERPLDHEGTHCAKKDNGQRIYWETK